MFEENTEKIKPLYKDFWGIAIHAFGGVIQVKTDSDLRYIYYYPDNWQIRKEVVDWYVKRIPKGNCKMYTVFA